MASNKENKDKFCKDTRNFLINTAKHCELNKTVMEMSKYGRTDEWEWFAESFSNSLNVIDDRDFENNSNLTDKENKKRN